MLPLNLAPVSAQRRVDNQVERDLAVTHTGVSRYCRDHKHMSGIVGELWVLRRHHVGIMASLIYTPNSTRGRQQELLRTQTGGLFQSLG